MTLDEKLASQIGDDVQHIFDHESLFKECRARIAALEAQIAAGDNLDAAARTLLDSSNNDKIEAAISTVNLNLLKLGQAAIDANFCAKMVLLLHQIAAGAEQ